MHKKHKELYLNLRSIHKLVIVKNKEGENLEKNFATQSLYKINFLEYI